MRLRLRGPGHFLLALGIAGLGVVCLVYGDFVPQWQPVPPWFPWRHAYAYASGAVLLAGSIGLLLPQVASRAALALTGYQLVWAAAEGQRALPSRAVLGLWLGFGEAMAEAVAAAVGCLTLYTLIAAAGAPRGASRRAWSRVLEVLFGASCVAFGLAHFAYADFTAGMIPAWVPARSGLTYLTGACHIAAGLALLTTLFARLAATLEALMLGGFILFVHLPSLASFPRWAPTRSIQWTELCLSLLICGSASVVARSLRDR